MAVAAGVVSRNPERIERIRDALRHEDLDGVVATAAVHVLMISGYWPVIGVSFAVVAREGTVAVLVPEDEAHLVAHGWADLVHTFRPGDLSVLRTPIDAAVVPLGRLLRDLGLSRARLGYERGPFSEPAPYAAVHVFAESVLDLLKAAAPGVVPIPADTMLEQLCSVKTPLEIERIQLACQIAREAFGDGVSAIVPGASEREIADCVRRGFSLSDTARKVERADGFCFCMSGLNSAGAYGAFAETGRRNIASGEPVLVHCNSYAEGYWTDITRTYTSGEPDIQLRRWYSAVLEARAAALEAIRPGVRGADVDRAARQVLHQHGLGAMFRHSAGHGVGFAAISANARPRLHPLSPDVLESGMVFNLEPAVYSKGLGGLRHCDVLALEAGGPRVLTAFHLLPDELVLAPERRSAA